ncbi:MAG TPA: hypothetical protein VMS60_01700 [Solirubrobacterales bacterium]|nr:hypothetical protein [Solirubrobacterales bacterium]
MRRGRPINADVPATETPEAAAEPESKSPPPEEESAPPAKAKPPKPVEKATPQQGFPGALKLVGGLALLGIVFLLIAIVGGGGGGEDDAAEAPAPVVAPPAQNGGEAPAAEPTELGYPAFATGNTTRVGGADPAANAAGVALAVFPSVTAAQRPAAVTLVNEDDWAGGIAGAVLMAAPVRAPVLISAADGAPDATEEALGALQPGGDKSTGGATAFAIGEVAAPGGKVTKVAAGSPAAEAAAIARLRERLSGSPPDHFVLAPEASPELAMPAAAWAARSGDPVLFSATEKLPKATAAVLESHRGVPVYVLGPSSAISSGVVREVAAISKQVKRVSGEDPVANAVAFARYDDEDFGWSINDPGHGFVLARTDAPLNAAAAAPLSASGTWGPLLLTDDAGTLPTELRSYFLDVKPGYTNNPTRAFYNHVWVIGDQEAIDVNQQAEVNELAELTRIGNAP